MRVQLTECGGIHQKFIFSSVRSFNKHPAPVSEEYHRMPFSLFLIKSRLSLMQQKTSVPRSGGAYRYVVIQYPGGDGAIKMTYVQFDRRTK